MKLKTNIFEKFVSNNTEDFKKKIDLSFDNQYCYIRYTKAYGNLFKFSKTLLSLDNYKWDSQKRAYRFNINDYIIVYNAFKHNIDFSDIGSTLKYEPYKYQKEFIANILYSNGLLLVAPCGAGKTIIGIGAFIELKRKKLIAQDAIGVILVKASLKTQWYNEVTKFSDLKANIIKTTATVSNKNRSKIKTIKNKIEKLDKIKDRYKIFEYQKQLKELKTNQNNFLNEQFEGYDLLILNYETLQDENILNKLISMQNKNKIEYIYADEIHKIANYKTLVSKTTCKLNKIKYKVGATATPISNNPENLYSIYRFLAPDIFGDHNSFARKFLRYSGYGRISGIKNILEFTAKYRDHIAVKTKEEISKFLPKLTVIPYYCEMTLEQTRANNIIMQELEEAKQQQYNLISKIGTLGFKYATKYELEHSQEYQQVDAKISMLQTFAQELADTPLLLEFSESKNAEKYKPKSMESPKIDLLLDLVNDIFESNEKVTIISRYKRMQKILTDVLLNKFKNIKIAYVHGNMSDTERFDNVYNKFRDDPDYKILIISDAGSFGINLSKCQYIIEFELAESYATQTQRHGRIERADSDFDNVFVYQLIAQGSYDEIQLKINSKKEGYDRDLIKSLA